MITMQSVRAALDDLDWHWGEAYEITEALGVWRAARRDSGVSLIASDPDELRGLIVSDYAARPVSRGRRTDVAGRAS